MLGNDLMRTIGFGHDGEIRFARESGCYDYTIVNDNLEDAIDQTVTLISQERQREQND